MRHELSIASWGNSLQLEADMATPVKYITHITVLFKLYAYTVKVGGLFIASLSVDTIAAVMQTTATAVARKLRRRESHRRTDSTKWYSHHQNLPG